MKTIIRSALLFGALWLVACNESPSTAFSDLIDDQARDDAYRNVPRSSSSYSDYDRCRLNGGTWDSYYGECNYGYYSSSYRSSSSAYYYTPTTYAYTTSQKTMRLTTTYYRQTASNWDILDNAGDPEISYKVTFKKKDSTTTYSWTTSYYIGEDYRSWSGSFYRELTVPANTYSINVRPSVIDRDVSSNDDRSSGYSVTWPAVGYMRNYETVKDTDDYGGYTLRYEWYLY